MRWLIVHMYACVGLPLVLRLQIVPQALCTGPRRLQIASKAYYLVLILMIVSFPISWCFAKVLDTVLGTHESRNSSFMYIDKNKLGINAVDGDMALIELHGYTDKKTAKEHAKTQPKINPQPSSAALMEEGLDGESDTDALVR